MLAISTRQLGFVVTLLVAFTSSPAVSQTVEIDPSLSIGPTIQRAGWDIKAFANRLNSVGEARGLYEDVDANFLRIPIFATAHNEDGSVDTSRYTNQLAAIRSIHTVNPDVEIYASLRLEGADTFPDWVSEGSSDWPVDTGRIFGNTVERPNPDFYSNMIVGYLNFLRNEGIAIDYLGLNNETEDAVPFDRYIDTYDQLQLKIPFFGINGEFADFQFVGPDSFGLPTAERFIRDVRDAGRLDTIDIVASHYYPQYISGNESDWQDLTALSGGKPIWHTEFHMPGNTDAINDLSQTVRDALSVMFASFRNGVDSYIWWDSGNRLDRVRDVVKREVMTTTLGATPVLTTPGYQGKGDPDGQALFQAFVHDGEVTLWIVNPGSDDMTNMVINLRSGEVGAGLSGVSYLAPDGDNDLQPSDITPLLLFALADGQSLVVDRIPSQSIAAITFSTAPVLTGDFDEDGDVDIDDINFYVGNIGANALGALADLDLTGNGSIGNNDLQFHIENFVQTSNGQAGTFLGDVNLDGSVNVLGDAVVLLGNLNSTANSYAQGDLNLDGLVGVLGDAFALVGNLGRTNDP